MLVVETRWWRVSLKRVRGRTFRPRVMRPYPGPTLDGARWWWWFDTKQLLFIFTMKDER